MYHTQWGLGDIKKNKNLSQLEVEFNSLKLKMTKMSFTNWTLAKFTEGQTMFEFSPNHQISSFYTKIQISKQ